VRLELSFDRILGVFGVLGIVIGAGVAIATAAKAKGEMLFAIGCFIFSGLTLCSTVGMWAYRAHVSLALRLSSTTILWVLIGVSTVQVSKWAERRYRAEPKPVTSLDERNRLHMLRRVRMDWIDGVLMQSLYRVARIELGMETNDDAVEDRLTAIVQSLDRPPAVIPAGTRMSQVFDDQAGAMLILGAPGTGKTTLLLELAKDLLDRAERDANYPIPVVFNLSSWAVRRLPLERWLISELNDRSDVPKKVAERWVEMEQIIPLLDGLDEVAPDHRQPCAEAINSFRRNHGLLPIAVCSRIADYEALGAKLRLRSAVVVQPLTKSQVRNYLEQVGEPVKDLRAALGRDSSLWEILETPLMLWVAILAYRDAPVEFFRADTLKLRRKRIFDKFIDAMFKRRSAKGGYTPEPTISWLSWLAAALRKNEQVVFYLEGLNETWLATRSQRWLFSAGIVLSSGLAGGMAGGMVCAGLGPWISNWKGDWTLKLIDGMLAGMISGLHIGLCVGLIGSFMNLRPIETIRISLVNISTRLRRAIKDGMIVAFSGALVFGLLGGLNGWLRSGLLRVSLGRYGAYVHLSWKDGVLLGLQVGLAFGLVALLSSEAVDTRRSPNQGTRRSARMGLLAGLTFGILSTLGNWRIYGGEYAVFWGTATIVVVGLFGGGLFCIRHLVLRLMLWSNGSAPLRYERFLNHAVEFLFLRKVGGGYIFIHRMLLEYFASLRTTPNVRRNAIPPRKID